MNKKEKEEPSKHLKHYYEECNLLLREFCLKHYLKYEGPDEHWVGGRIGETAYIGDYFFNMSVIVTDLRENPSEEELMNWYEYDLRCASLGLQTVNYESWLKGCPRHSEETFIELEKAQKKAKEAKEEFMNLLKEHGGTETPYF